jgi:hypothetical protein
MASAADRYRSLRSGTTAPELPAFGSSLTLPRRSTDDPKRHPYSVICFSGHSSLAITRRERRD